MYILTATRPDISTTVIVLICCLSKENWNGVKRLLRYINGTLDFGLKFTASEDVEANENGNELYGYSDANWEGDVDTRRSHRVMCLK